MSLPAFDLCTPARYRICVRGYVPDSWSDRLAGMDIARTDPAGETPVTTLDGWLIDQSALLGVLNALQGLHLPLLSVECLATETAGEQPVGDK